MGIGDSHITLQLQLSSALGVNARTHTLYRVCSATLRTLSSLSLSRARSRTQTQNTHTASGWQYTLNVGSSIMYSGKKLNFLFKRMCNTRKDYVSVCHFGNERGKSFCSIFAGRCEMRMVRDRGRGERVGGE